MAERICSGMCPHGDVRDEDEVGVGMFLAPGTSTSCTPVVSPRPISQPTCVT